MPILRRITLKPKFSLVDDVKNYEDLYLTDENDTHYFGVPVEWYESDGKIRSLWYRKSVWVEVKD